MEIKPRTIVACGILLIMKVKQKKTIYFVDYKSQADLLIYFVDYKNQAGWINNSKKAFTIFNFYFI